MKFNVMLPLRAFQGLFAATVLVISIIIAHWYNTTMVVSSPNQLNMLLFSALWSLITMVVLEVVPRFFPRASNPYIFLALESSNVVFLMGSWISLAVFISRLDFCRGYICSLIIVDAVFGALLFCLWAGTMGIMARTTLKGGLRKPTTAGAAGAYAPKETA